MIKKVQPVYTEKLYCTNCYHVFQIKSGECEICGHVFMFDHFLADERQSDLHRVRAARSMYQYNLKMGNIQ